MERPWMVSAALVKQSETGLQYMHARDLSPWRSSFTESSIARSEGRQTMLSSIKALTELLDDA